MKQNFIYPFCGSSFLITNDTQKLNLITMF